MTVCGNGLPISSHSGGGGTDAGFLAAVERKVTGILYDWAGLDGDGANEAEAGAMQAKFLDSYFGNQAGIGIVEVPMSSK
jgi:hypothetical protein